MFEIFPVYTPADCTDVVSPIDDNVGAYIKRRMGEKFDAEHENMQEEWEYSLTAPKRRMLMVKWASEVWDEICNDPDRCKSLLRRSLLRTGFLVAKDGSENGLILLDGWMQEGEYDF
jgi:hypothetical protein